MIEASGKGWNGTFAGLRDSPSGSSEVLRKFYGRVTGWTAEPVSMGDYSDFNMAPPTGKDPVAGICHARGLNADLPPVWLIYIVAQDLEASLKACLDGGGEVLAGPKSMGPGSSFAVISDPAGAVCALYQVGDEAERS